MENRNKVSRDIAYQKENIKRIPFSIQLSEYDILKAQAANMPMNTFIKKALNSYTGQEIFKVQGVDMEDRKDEIRFEWDNRKIKSISKNMELVFQKQKRHFLMIVPLGLMIRNILQEKKGFCLQELP